MQITATVIATTTKTTTTFTLSFGNNKKDKGKKNTKHIQRI